MSRETVADKQTSKLHMLKHKTPYVTTTEIRTRMMNDNYIKTRLKACNRVIGHLV